MLTFRHVFLLKPGPARRHAVPRQCCSMYNSLTPGQSDSHIALAAASLSPRLTSHASFFQIPSTNKTRVSRENSSAAHPQQCLQCRVPSQKITKWCMLIFIFGRKCQDTAFLFFCPFQPFKPTQLFYYIFIVKTSWYAEKYFVTEQLKSLLCTQKTATIILRKNKKELLKNPNAVKLKTVDGVIF